MDGKSWREKNEEDDLLVNTILSSNYLNIATKGLDCTTLYIS
jgi:hypothetical protein